MALAPLSVAVPLVAAALLALTAPLKHHRLAAATGIVATLIAGGLCLALLLRSGDGTTVVWLGGWTPHRGTAVGVSFTVDALAAGMGVLTCVLALAAQVAAAQVIRTEDQLFDALLLVFVAAALGMCFAGDLFNLLVWLELISVCGYVLVGYEVGQRKPLAGALGFAVIGSVGGILMLFGIGLLYAATGALNLAGVGRALASTPGDAAVVAGYGLVLTGLLVKTAAVPFHFWTADAYTVAPTPVSLLLAGVYAELGLYAIARLHWSAFAPLVADHEPLLRGVLVGLGVLTATVGATMCAQQRDLKRLLAFATIAQVGLLVVAVGLLDRAALGGVGIWVVGDGLAKAALFTVVGVVRHRHGTVDEEELWGRLRDAPVLAAVFGGAALCVASLPPFGPFLGKALVEHALLHGGPAWLMALYVGVPVVVGGTLLRAWARTVLGWGPRPRRAEEHERQQQVEDAAEVDVAHPVTLALPAAVLLLGAMAWGTVPGLRAAVARAAATFADPAGYAARVLDGRSPGAVDAVSLPAPTPGAYLTAAAVVLAALAWGAVAVRRPSGLPAPLRRPVGALRGLHSGHVGDYVAWAVVGTSLLLVVLVAGSGNA